MENLSEGQMSKKKYQMKTGGEYLFLKLLKFRELALSLLSFPPHHHLQWEFNATENRELTKMRTFFPSNIIICVENKDLIRTPKMEKT